MPNAWAMNAHSQIRPPKEIRSRAAVTGTPFGIRADGAAPMPAIWDRQGETPTPRDADLRI
jgi:hypothetical protein